MVNYGNMVIDICPNCGREIDVDVNLYEPSRDWHPSFNDPDSGGEPIRIKCKCGFQFCTGTYDITEFLEEWNKLERNKQEIIIKDLEQVKTHFGEPENQGIAASIIDDAIEELRRLGKYEGSKVNISLPCNTGDKVYHYCRAVGRVLEYEVEFIIICDGITNIGCSAYTNGGTDDIVKRLDKIEADITEFNPSSSTPYSFVSTSKSEVEDRIRKESKK